MDTSVKNISNFRDQLMASPKFPNLPGWIAKKGNPSSIRLVRGLDWCWILLYQDHIHRSRMQIGALIRLLGPTGEAAWHALDTQAKNGDLALPKEMSLQYRTNGGRARWNVEVTRDFSISDAPTKEEQFSWLCAWAIELAKIVDSHIASRSPPV